MAKHYKDAMERARDKRKLKQAALLWWTQTIYQLAHDACVKTDAYDNSFQYWETVIPILKRAATELNQLGSKKELRWSQRLNDQSPPPPASANCDSDDDCPDDYICVEGYCEFLFVSE